MRVACASAEYKKIVLATTTPTPSTKHRIQNKKFGHTQSFRCYAAWQNVERISNEISIFVNNKKKCLQLQLINRRRDTVCACVCVWMSCLNLRDVCACAAYCCTVHHYCNLNPNFATLFEQKCVNHTGFNYLEVSQCARSPFFVASFCFCRSVCSTSPLRCWIVNVLSILFCV